MWNKSLRKQNGPFFHVGKVVSDIESLQQKPHRKSWGRNKKEREQKSFKGIKQKLWCVWPSILSIHSAVKEGLDSWPSWQRLPGQQQQIKEREKLKYTTHYYIYSTQCFVFLVGFKYQQIFALFSPLVYISLQYIYIMFGPFSQ